MKLTHLIHGLQRPAHGPVPHPHSRKNVKAPAKPLQKKDINYEQNKREIIAHFQQRQDSLNIVKTTTTSKNQTIDWIPVGSQGIIATPPPPPVSDLIEMLQDPKASKAIPELAAEGVEKGPEGTVPILRKNLEKLSFTQSLDMYLSKTKGSNTSLSSNMNSTRMLVPASVGVHRYANSQQTVLNYGGQGSMSNYSPYVQSSGDFSLLQIGCLGTNLGYYQTVEVGWQVYHDINGDFNPHLFTYFTNNGYQQSGDNLGGYNRDVAGWVQVSTTIFPGTTFTPYSVPGGAQDEIGIKVQQYQGNWWVSVQNSFIGYYPGSLYKGTMPDHADALGWWGEVYDSEGRTTTDMGSGQFPGANDAGNVAYMRNLQYQNDGAGSMLDYSGAAGNSDPDMYQIDAHFNSGTTWGSYAWLGGPGAG